MKWSSYNCQIFSTLTLWIIILSYRQHAGAETTLSFKDQCLKWHNDYRQQHQVATVVWNETLARNAAVWASYLADNNLFEHATNIPNEGENLYMSTAVPNEPCTAATQAFYNEIKDYDFNKPGFSLETGHFTQIVWKTTKQIGAASATRQDGRFVIVIRYTPPGNFVGEISFKENVLPPKDWQAPTEAGVTRLRSFSPMFVACWQLLLGLHF